jgi:dimethylargininase
MRGHLTALVRGVPGTFAEAIKSDQEAPLDVALARAQHAEYVGRLKAAGYQVVEVATDPAFPDCLFIEDTAVVVRATAVATNPGAASRRGEVAPVRSTLATWFETEAIEEPGTLDGSDVIVLGDRLLIGRSRRTNAAGAAQLVEVGSRLGLAAEEIAVSAGLHLKSAVLPLDAETLVVTPGAVDEGALSGFRVVYEDETERFRFSALPLADGSVLVTANSPRTTGRVADLGFDVVPMDVSQIQEADGDLTCLSIIFESP